MDSLIAETGRQWERVAGSKSVRLLRLAVLRDFARSLHTVKSEYLSTGRAGLASQLGRDELALNERFPSLPISSMSFDEVLVRIREARLPSSPAEQTVSAPELPPELLAALGASKLTRLDRAWERALVEEASRLGWSFWQMEAPVDVHHVESWAKRFSECLWPKGIVLFIESDGFLRASASPSRSAFWRGKWSLSLDPSVARPEELGIDFESWPGSSGQPPSPRWKLLFPGRKV